LSNVSDLNLGIVILTNRKWWWRTFTAVSNTIADNYLGLDDFGWTDKVVDWMKQGRNSDDEVTKKFGKKVKSSKNVKVKMMTL
jgi:hypothetical protein